MGDVIALPGVDPAAIRPRPACLDDLFGKARALAVVRQGIGYDIELRPAVDDAEGSVRMSFHSARQALVHARRLSASYPLLYPFVIDETARGRRSLDRILGPGPDPMGVGGDV
jgi:hypothetical protein